MYRKSYQGEGIAASLVSEVILVARNKGIVDLFVHTKPVYEPVFNSLGFGTIAKIDNVVFLENKSSGINNYCSELKKSYVDEEKIGALVINLNPITNGYMYLIKQVASMCDHVHLFIVKEDNSSFLYDIRLELLTKCVDDIKNLTIHVGSDYVISSATFPTYFIKNSDDVDKTYPKLGIAIFTKYIANTLNINMRFVGEEPYSKTTNIYNEIVSASKAREMIIVGNVCDINDKGALDFTIRARVKTGSIIRFLY